jgi:hypothetical protein
MLMNVNRKQCGGKMKAKKPAVHKTVRIPHDLNGKLDKRRKKEGRTFAGMVIFLLNKVIDKK